jgi:pimeloyl-ACP methyl ester carboxylesterase
LTQLHHIRRGAGEPLLLIHPLGSELVVWEPVIDLLAVERDVIAVDMPGFGGSPPLPQGQAYTPHGLATALARFLDGLDIERAHLAGNSLGGWVALELAGLGRARSVTGLSPAGFWARPLGPRSSRARDIGRAVLPLVGALVRSERGRRILLGASVGHPERVPPDSAARLVRSYLTAPAFEEANAAMRAAVFAGIERIDAPVTLAWAELDRLVAEPRGGVPGARRVVLRGCGHIPTWDDPPQVSRVLLEAGPAAARRPAA